MKVGVILVVLPVPPSRRIVQGAEVLLICMRAGVAELADAADSKSAAGHPAWGFNSPLQHQDPFLPALSGLKSVQKFAASLS